MPRVKKTSRRPLARQRLAGVTVTVQRTKKSGYEACVIMRRDGKRLRERYLHTIDEAEALAEKWCIETGNTGAQAAASFTDSHKRYLIDAESSLAKYGKTLKDALAFYLTHLQTTHSSKPIHEAVDALLLHRQRKGKSERYQYDLRLKLESLETRFPERMIGEITAAEVEAWLDSLTVAPVTYNNFRRVLHVLWAFALDKQWVRENVVSRIELKTVRAQRPGILTVAQARALLNASDPAILPYFAIALFGGVRDAELKRLDWRDVQFLTGYIRIDASVSKTGRERLVPITDNLKEWLHPVAKPRGPITPDNWRALIFKARKTAKIMDWPHDATRHSFGTYEMARTKDIGHVSEVMGNSPAICQRHYKAAVPFEQGDEYFAINPTTESNIVLLAGTAAA
ncbi:MAG: tyrosine-type recombinase/integrase [Verrucomicrobia bacterium]|nr:tyrosine-type recombinase/integrase [Verrucomicrobiota bacterium]